MRQAYLVTYDISDPKRLRLVYQTMRGYGDHVQLSVFRCELSERARLELCGKLSDIMHLGEDQVLFVDLGPAEGRARACIASLGRPYTHPERVAIVV